MKEVYAWEARTRIGRWRCRATRHDVFCKDELEDCHARFRLHGASHDEYDRRPTTRFIGVTLRRKVLGTPYWSQMVASARLIVGEVDDLPTGRLLGRMKNPPPLDQTKRYSEPGRFGVRRKYQHTSIGRTAILRLVGRLATSSVALGFRHFLIMGREPLLKAIYWLPVALSEALEYPEEDGGPRNKEPDWAGTMRVDEIAAATRLRPKIFGEVFPAGTTWVDPDSVRPDGVLRAIAAQSQATVRADVAAWRAYLLSGEQGQSPLAKLAPPPVV